MNMDSNAYTALAEAAAHRAREAQRLEGAGLSDPDANQGRPSSTTWAVTDALIASLLLATLFMMFSPALQAIATELAEGLLK